MNRIFVIKKYVLTALVFSACYFSLNVQAVQLNPDGHGEVLIYPYYTVRQGEDGSAYNTLLLLTNNTDDAKAVHLIMYEGRNGVLFADTTVFLKPRDMWTAALSPEGDSHLLYMTKDESCLFSNRKSSVFPSWDMGLGTSPQEGYIEVFEMGTIPSTTQTYRSLLGGNCDGVRQTAEQDVVGKNTGGLIGNTTIINVQSGFSFSVPVVALDQFAKPGTALGYYGYAAGSIYPSLTLAHPISVVPGNGEDLLLISEWENGVDAVKAVLKVDTITNEYVLANSTISKTAWVLNTSSSLYPLADTWSSFDIADINFSIEPVLYDREGNSYRRWSGPIGVPPPGWGKPTAVNESNKVIEFQPSDSALFFSTAPIDNGLWRPSEFINGFVNLEVGGEPLKNNKTKIIRADGTILENQSVTYYGAPVMGFSAMTYTNAVIDLPGGKVGRSIYGVTQPHSYTRRTRAFLI